MYLATKTMTINPYGQQDDGISYSKKQKNTVICLEIEKKDVILRR